MGTTLREAAPALLAALEVGDHAAIVELLEPFPAQERTALRRSVTGSAKAILGAPGGARDPEGRWRGALRNRHGVAAETALLATASLSQALRQRTLDGPVARDHLPRLFPDDLPDFVESFSARFLTNPRAWDGNRGIEAIFDWAQSGLVAPPTQRGAVLALICWAAWPSPWEYLHQRPVLLRTTLPRLFEVPGVKGASAAQRDETGPAPRLDSTVIPRLIREGEWHRDEVLAWCETALSVERSEYEKRWFRALAERVAKMPAPPSQGSAPSAENAAAPRSD